MIEREQRLRILILAAVAVAVVALAVSLAAPSGSGARRCNSLALSIGREQCLYQLALSSENATLCGSLGNGDSNSCYITIAEETKNSSVCYKTGSANGTAACVVYIANATDSYRLCNGLSATYRDSCIGSMAIRDRNPDLCAQISNRSNGTICSSAINLSEALRSGNASRCSGVENTTDINTTLAILGQSGIDSYSRAYSNVSNYLVYATFFGNNQFGSRDFCYLAVATQARNRSMCSDISNSTLQESCVVAMLQPVQVSNSLIYNAINYGQLAGICSNSNLSAGAAENCSNFITIVKAINTKNTTLCATLALNFSYECYAELAAQYYNASYCNYINNLTLSNACVENISYNSTAALNGTRQPGYP